jgi:hypothetical protein
MRIAVDVTRTFEGRPLFFMSSQPKTKYDPKAKTHTPDLTKDGTAKWTVTVAVTTIEFGKPKPTMFPFTVVSDKDPAEGLLMGTPVEPVNLMQGINEPKIKGDRIDGGRPYYGADGVRPLAPGKGA